MAYFAAEENVTGLALYLPTAIKGLGYTSTSAQLRTIPVYGVTVVVTLLFAQLSDRLRQRFYFTMLGSLLVIIGLIIELAQPPQPGVRYLGLFFAMSGSFAVMAIVTVWLAINLGNGYKRAAALGILVPIGHAGSILSANVFLANEAPRFRTGFAVGMAMNTVGIIALVLLYLDLKQQNRRKGQAGVVSPLPSDRKSEGEGHPSFRYVL